MEDEKLRIQQIACDFVRSIGKDPDAYLVRIEKDCSDFKVLFIPKRRRIRGGGLRVYVTNDMNLKDVVYLQ